jgi:hypothetical protein
MGFLDSNDPDVQSYMQQLQQRAQAPQGVLNQVDPTWLAVAQGLLAPTKTGGFGESLSNAANALQGPLSQMKNQQLSAMDKIMALKETQARLALQKQKQDQDTNPDNEYLNNEYKRALTINQNISAINSLKGKYVDNFGEFKSDKDKEEFERLSKPLWDKISDLQSRTRPGGTSSIEAATGAGNPPLSIPNTQVNPPQAQGNPLKEGDFAYNPQGIRFVVKNGKLVQDQQPGQR